MAIDFIPDAAIDFTPEGSVGGIDFTPAAGVSFEQAPPPIPEPIIPDEPPIATVKSFAREAEDVARGAWEGPYAVASGLAGFLTSTPIALMETTLPEPGRKQFGLTERLARARDTQEKLMESTAYHPTSRFGQTIVEVASAPFTVAHDFLASSLRDRAWRRSLSPEDLKEVSEGRKVDPKAMKEGWLKENPEAGVEEGKAASFLFDSALFGLPLIKGKLQRGEVPTPEELRSGTEQVLETFKEEKSPEAAEIGIQDAASDALDRIRAEFKDTKRESFKKATPEEDVALEPRILGNQKVANDLKAIAEGREGRSKSNYNRAAKIVEEYKGDIATADLNEVWPTKGKKSKIRDAIKDALPKEELIVPIEPRVPEVDIPIEPPVTATAEQRAVNGLQIEKDNLTARIAKVEGRTKAKLEKKLELVEEDLKGFEEEINVRWDSDAETFIASKGDKFAGYLNISKVGDTNQLVSMSVDLEFRKQGVGTKLIEAAKDKYGDVIVDPKHVPADVKNLVDKLAKKAEPIEGEIPKFSSVEDVRGFKVMSEVDRDIAKADLLDIDSEFQTVQVGDKFYRMERDVEMEQFREQKGEQPEVDFVEDVEVEPTRDELMQVEQELKAEIDKPSFGKAEQENPEVLAVLQKMWKERYVDKINEAGPTTKPAEPKDLIPIDDNFTTFKSRLEADAYAEAKELEGEVAQDPLSGEYYIEPELKDLEDYRYEENLDATEVETRYDGPAEDYAGIDELSDTGVKSLVDIFNNERGAVDVTDMRILADKLREIQDTAKKMGRSVEDLLDSLGMTPEAIRQVVAQIEGLPETEKRTRELDPILEEMFNPESGIHSQTVKRTKTKGDTRTIPVSKDWEIRLRNTPRDSWGKKVVRQGADGTELITFEKGKIAKFMALTEIPLRAFKRFGLEEIWYDWTALERERLDWVKAEQKEVKAITKGLSKKELHEIALAAEADQAGGREILAGMGVTEIPTLSPKQRGAVDWFRKHFDKMHDRINYNRTNMGQYAMPYVENYFPRMRQLNVLKERGLIDNLTTLTPSRANALVKEFSGIFNPHALKRTKAKDLPVELDIVKGYLRYIDFASSDMYTAPIGALAKELANSKVLKEGKRGKTPFVTKNPEAAILLDRWADDILHHDDLAELNKKYPGVKAFSNYIHRNLVSAILLGSVTTVLKQVGAFTGTLSEAGPAYTIWGALRYMGEKPITKIGRKLTRAKEKSNILNIRRSDIYFEKIHELWVSGDIGTTGEGIRQIAGMPMNVLDAITAEISWNAFYDYATRGLKMDETAAFRWAEEKTAYTQAVGIRGATAPIQNIPIVSLATLFQTFAINDFNYVARDLLGIKNPDPKNFNHFRKVMRYVVGGYLLNSIAQLGNVDPPHPQPFVTYQEHIEEGDINAEALAFSFLELFEKVPLIGGAIKYDSSLFGAVGELAADVPTAAKYAIAMLDWNNMSVAQRFRAGLFIGHVLGRVYGITMSNQIRKSIRTASQGGNTWEIILGTYIEEARKQGVSRPPGISGSIPSF